MELIRCYDKTFFGSNWLRAGSYFHHLFRGRRGRFSFLLKLTVMIVKERKLVQNNFLFLCLKYVR